MIILVCDDERATRECLTEALRLQGHQTAACSSVEAADPMIPYVDAVICDGFSGGCFDLVVTCELRNIPLVVYTGDAEIADAADAVGVRHALKPAGVEELLAALTREEVAA